VSRKLSRRTVLTLESLEGREAPSGLVATPEFAPQQSSTQADIAQQPITYDANLNWPGNNGR
jgi:hypothetical protein